VVERPLRLKFQLTPENLEWWSAAGPERLRSWSQWLPNVFGYTPHRDWNEVRARLDVEAKMRSIKIRDADRKKVREAFCERDEEAIEVLKDPKEPNVFEPDPELRDTENVPLKENVEEYFKREVLPHVPDAWIDDAATKIGYEISFTKHFYRYQPLRSLEEITTDLWTLEAETAGLLHRITDDLHDVDARVVAPLNGTNGHISSTPNGHAQSAPQEETP
jgi:type I restriction enzyme M protein